MKKINEAEVSAVGLKSPKGDFQIQSRHLSLALGGIKDTGEWGGGHPFDIEIALIPPGKKNYPIHSHAAQWEHYIILSGSGRFIHGTDASNSTPISQGDHIICEPGEAHQLYNDGEVDLKYYVIADHHRADVTTYPKTGKRQIKPEYKVITYSEADYYEGEE